MTAYVVEDVDLPQPRQFRQVQALDHLEHYARCDKPGWYRGHTDGPLVLLHCGGCELTETVATR